SNRAMPATKSPTGVPVLATAGTGSEAGGERVLIDPMAIDPSGTTTLDIYSPSWETELLAYQLSKGGDEESNLYVMEVESGRQVEGPIDRCRYSTVSWLPGGEAFYYTRRLHPARCPNV